MGRSPAHYRYFLDHPTPVTPAMLMGDRVDSLIFGTRLDEFEVWEGDRRGNPWKEFKEVNAAKTILTASEDATAHAIADSIGARREVCDRLNLAYQQVNIRWDIAGRDCEGTPDAHDLRRVTELKVCHDVSPDRFMWHALKQGWVGQITWYADGLGIKQPELSIVAVEPKPPHVVQVYELTQNAILLGQQQWRLYFERLRVHEDSDYWPGYCESPLPLDAPEKFSLMIDGEEVDL
jgi:hypothetical protein